MHKHGLVLVLLLFGAGVSARADTLTFNFNSLASGLGSSSIQSYMNSWLSTQGCTGCSVVVGAGAVTDKNTYDADGHVVGPTSHGSTTELTLGNTEHAVSSALPAAADASLDTYLRNAGGTSSPDDRITMVFTGFSIDSAAFDFEIFPDGTAQQPPDFIFTAKDKNGNVVFSNTWLGASVSAANTTYTRSPASSHESNAQLLGTWSGNFATPVSELDFVDWPATVAVDNLDLTINHAPEPGTMVLLGTVLAGMLALRRKKFQA